MTRSTRGKGRKITKHGRTGRVRVQEPRPNGSQADTTSPAYQIGYQKGYEEGASANTWLNDRFLEDLLTKKSAKDIHGLINRRLGRG